MKNLIFPDNACVEIKTKEQYNKTCKFLRNPTPIDDELENVIYLENANSATSGHSIGIIFKPVGTWSKKPLNVISFEDAIKTL